MIAVPLVVHLRIVTDATQPKQQRFVPNHGGRQLTVIGSW